MKLKVGTSRTSPRFATRCPISQQSTGSLSPYKAKNKVEIHNQEGMFSTSAIFEKQIKSQINILWRANKNTFSFTASNVLKFAHFFPEYCCKDYTYFNFIGTYVLPFLQCFRPHGSGSPKSISHSTGSSDYSKTSYQVVLQTKREHAFLF